MAKKKAKRGPKPKPPDQRRSVTLPAVRVTPQEMDALVQAAGPRKLSEEIRRRLFGGSKQESDNGVS